jgi:hypothetical protein
MALSRGLVTISLGLVAASPVTRYRPWAADALGLLPPLDQTGQIAVLSARARLDSGYAVVCGRVRNTSRQVCRRLEVVGETLDMHDTALTMGSALVANTSLRPGETTSFRLILDHWPRGDRVRLTFRPLSLSPHTTRELPASVVVPSQIGR